MRASRTFVNAAAWPPAGAQKGLYAAGTDAIMPRDE